MDRDDLLVKGLAAAKELEGFRLAEAEDRSVELVAKINLEVAKAAAETAGINSGMVTGKTLVDRERELIMLLQDDKIYRRREKAWLEAANARHIAEARSECARLVAEMYRNALVEGVRA